MGVAGVLVAVLALLSPAALAATCEEQVAAFADQHGLTAAAPSADSMGTSRPEAPGTVESRGLDMDRLARSGGVVDPPDQGADMAVKPPPTDRRMETAPDAQPEAGPDASGPDASGSEAGETVAADRERAESLLMGATSAAKQGNEEECLNLLKQAKEGF